MHSKIKKEKRTVKKEKKTSKLNFISHFLKISIILSQVVKLIKEKLYMISILQYFFITKEVKKWLKGEFNDLSGKKKVENMLDENILGGFCFLAFFYKKSTKTEILFLCI